MGDEWVAQGTHACEWLTQQVNCQPSCMNPRCMDPPLLVNPPLLIELFHTLHRIPLHGPHAPTAGSSCGSHDAGTTRRRSL